MATKRTEKLGPKQTLARTETKHTSNAKLEDCRTFQEPQNEDEALGHVRRWIDNQVIEDVYEILAERLRSYVTRGYVEVVYDGVAETSKLNADGSIASTDVKRTRTTRREPLPNFIVSLFNGDGRDILLALATVALDGHLDRSGEAIAWPVLQRAIPLLPNEDYRAAVQEGIEAYKKSLELEKFMQEGK
jgi:hypothetical protein